MVSNVLSSRLARLLPWPIATFGYLRIKRRAKPWNGRLGNHSLTGTLITDFPKGNVRSVFAELSCNTRGAIPKCSEPVSNPKVLISQS